MTDIQSRKLDTPELYQRVLDMSESDRQEILDPICRAVRGKTRLDNGVEVAANRVFALLVLDLYLEWQSEIFDRD